MGKYGPMIRNIYFIALLSALLLSACQDSSKPETPVIEPETKTGKEILDDLKAQAIEEDDLLGRLNSGIKTVQEEFTKSEAAMPDLQNVQVTIDENCLLSIRNGNQETRVDMHLLNAQTGGMSLIPDLNEGEFPGIRIETIDQEPVVEMYQNGKLVNKNNELVIHLATRKSIERIAPALVQTVQLCQSKPE